MTGRLKDIIFTRKGEQIISFITRSDFSEAFDALKDADVEVEIRKHRPRRSNDANAYCWTLIDKLASETAVTKEEMYRKAIRSIGGVSEIVCVRAEAFDKLKAVWCAKGIGWQVDQMPSKIDGCVNAVLYYGSSTYDTGQMSSLIDNLIQDCRALGIPTDTPEQIARIKSLWADGDDRRPAQKKGNVI